MAFGIGLFTAGTFKWIPKLFPIVKGPVGGITGGIGALGGFIFPLLTTPITDSGDGVENFAKAIYIWTVSTFVLFFANIGL